MTDPVSGQTVCSCQYDSARLALSSYPRLSTSGVGVYGTPYPSTDQNPYPSIGVDSSAFYSPLVRLLLLLLFLLLFARQALLASQLRLTLAASFSTLTTPVWLQLANDALLWGRYRCVPAYKAPLNHESKAQGFLFLVF
jgi:hypothetical protein